MTRLAAEVAYDEVYVTFGTAEFGVQRAGPDLCVWRELVLDAADVEEERFQFLKLGGRDREKAGGSSKVKQSKNGGSAICFESPSYGKIDVLVKGCPGSLLVLLESVCGRLKSVLDLALRSIKGR